MTLLSKLYAQNKTQAVKDILKIYQEKKSAVIHYMYFANAISNGVVWHKKLHKDFYHALLDGDFVLPDGIALQLYYKKYFWIQLPNLNGTDFSEYFFSHVSPEKVQVILYGGKQKVVKKASEYLFSKYSISPFYIQDGYSDFRFEALDKLSSGKINILLVGLGTPLQEIWTQKYKDMIQKYQLLVFTQWGTFDFWAGNEKRAPNIFIKWKLEWFWRLITNPKKNFKKVWYSFYLFYYLSWYKKK